MQALADDQQCMQTTDEAHTVTHEIAHTCGSHDGHVPDSLMEEHAPTDQNDFAASSLLVFREEVAW